MGEVSKIRWTHHTYNPWRGCTEVSPACDHCYARELAKRNPGVLGQWGPGAPRVEGSAGYLRGPLKWNAEAERPGVRRRVFALSMGDWLDEEAPAGALADLLLMVSLTPYLDWLLLTKRPHNFFSRVSDAKRLLAKGDSEERQEAWRMLWNWLATDGSGPPHNVWIGCTAENQRWANRRVPELLNIPARVRFLSCEPLLGPIDLEAMPLSAEDPLFSYWPLDGRHLRDGMNEPAALPGAQRLHWVIAGGESGHNARPMRPEWARGLRDQCTAAGVPFFFKQWGVWGAGGVREGKEKTGWLLDGVEWSQFPVVEGRAVYE